jgi:hypothetical protein
VDGPWTDRTLLFPKSTLPTTTYERIYSREMSADGATTPQPRSAIRGTEGCSQINAVCDLGAYFHPRHSLEGGSITHACKSLPTPLTPVEHPDAVIVYSAEFLELVDLHPCRRCGQPFEEDQPLRWRKGGQRIHVSSDHGEEA